MRILVYLTSVLVSFFLVFCISGCQIDYILKSGYHQALLIKDQEPIKDYLKNPNIPEDQKKKLNLVLDVKNFAENELGLKKSSNYTTYVELDRKFVSYIVQVAYPFELKYHYWKFPIVGSVPYKGYFVEDDAKKEADSFAKDGYDTFVRGVRAYSTLGWFRDAVLSSMMGYEEDDLVNLIIHETTHTTLYIKSSADFNEQLATFIGNKGTELYYEKTEGKDSPTLKKIKLKNEDETIFSQFITTEVQELDSWYKSNTGKITNEEKEKRLAQIQEKFKSLKFKTPSYEYFKTMKLNNAILLGHKTYVNDLSKFEKVFEKKSNIKEFIQTLKKLEHSKDPEKDIYLL
jgi:predicted aminopeptidase